MFIAGPSMADNIKCIAGIQFAVGVKVVACPPVADGASLWLVYRLRQVVSSKQVADDSKVVPCTRWAFLSVQTAQDVRVRSEGVSPCSDS